jgi:hypothetical protein
MGWRELLGSLAKTRVLEVEDKPPGGKRPGGL